MWAWEENQKTVRLDVFPTLEWFLMLRYRFNTIQKSIAATLLKAVFSIYLLVALVVTLVHISVEYYYTKNKIYQEIQLIYTTFAPGLSESLWHFNLEQVRQIVQGMAKVPIIVGLELENEEGDTVEVIGITSNQPTQVDSSTSGFQEASRIDLPFFALYKFHFPILYKDENEDHTVGHIIIYSSSAVVFQRIQLGFLFIIVNAVIKTLALWIIFLWIARSLLQRPLHIFTEITKQLDLDNLENTKVDIQITDRNELKILEETFNTMIRKLSEDTTKIMNMTTTFEKFVPKQFLERIATEGIETIRLGNTSTEYITILFSDIRSFTTLAEQMSPQEVFKFLNSYLARMNGPIQQNDGYIDKYIGDAIMALFDQRTGTNQQEAKSAVQAAIDMQNELQNYNRHRHNCNYPPISTGIGIHSGQVTIGTLGSENRMDTTAIGDTVNIASRLERLTKYYNVSIIISSATFQLLEDDDSILWRKLDYVGVKGKTELINIFEIFNSDLEFIKEKKQEIVNQFHEGLTMFHTQQWSDAIKLFQECLSIYPRDLVSQMYLKRSLKFKDHPPSSDWNGALMFKHK